MPSIRLGQFLADKNILKPFIKIDVEGAEYKVIKGMKDYLEDNNAIVVMEYLSSKRGNVAHQDAHRLLISLGYNSHSINNKGVLNNCDDIQSYMDLNKMESDNVVYIR